MSEPAPSVEKLEKQLRMLKKKLERSEWHRVDLENQHDRDQHLYRRLQTDLEAAKREAEIEAALERIRAQSLQMQHSSELVATSAVFHEQLLALGVPTEFSYVWLPDEAAGQHQFWATWTTEEDGETVHRSKAITYDLDKEEPYTAACFAAWEGEERFLVDFIPPADIAHFFEIWDELIGNADHLRPDLFPEGLYYAEAYMDFGCLGINIRREPTEEERDILRRFAVEFERAYTRFLDLKRAEAQTRDAEIEASLERVRSRAMAMRSSDELREMVLVILNEMKALAFPSGWCTIVLFDRETGDADFWMSGLTDDALPERYRVPYHELPTYKALHDGWRQGTPFFEIELAGEVKREQDRFFHEETEFRRLPEAAKEGMRRFGDIWLSNAATTHGVVQAVGPEPLSEENAAILQRFAKVIDLTYTRVEDIRQSEAQVREAQIEAALERVRSRTMGMQSSDELAEVSLLLDREVRALGTKTWGCAFNIYGEGESTEWFGSEAGVKRPYKTPREEFFLRFYEKGQAGETFHVETFEGAACRAHYDYMLTLPGLGDMLAEIEAAGHTFPTSQIDHVAYFKHGYLLFITLEPAPEAHDIFKRFAKVFEQTYTRFLDLQQAEEQAREADIEAALERVRSRTMGMRSSDELREVVATVYEQLHRLGVDAPVCMLATRDESEDGYRIWMANFYQPLAPESYHIPPIDHPVYRQTTAAWDAGLPGLTLTIEGDEKQRYGELLFAETEMQRLPRPVRDRMHGLDRVTITAAFTPHSFLEASGPNPLSDADTEILQRVAQVFEQSYTRFLDLKRAEAQAREAQIEAALERVRSRALEMTASDELLDVIFKIRHEYAGLGLECGAFWHTRYTPESYHKALTGIDGQKLAAIMELPRDFASNPALEAWERGAEKVGVFPFDAAAACEYLGHMIAKGHYLEVDPEAFTEEMIRENGGWTFVQARTSHGEIGYSLWGETEPSQEAKDVLVRFAATFDLAYRRFLDLQRAEADHQALVAEKAATDRALVELRATQAQLVQKEKMASLGQLTAGIAHEIKNPLNFVNNFAQLSKELVDELAEVDSEAERDEILGDLRQNALKIEEHGRRADAIVRSMMEHARSGSGPHRPVALNPLVEEHATHALHAARVRHPEFEPCLEVRLGDDVGEVVIEPQEIGRVLVNLVDNALDAVRQAASTNGAHVPAVTVSTRRTETGVEIRVEDNGTGMTEAVRAKVFEPFFTTKPTGEGTGLGLSLSHDIVAQGHGGALTVESAEGEGAAFVVSLPVE